MSWPCDRHYVPFPSNRKHCLVFKVHPYNTVNNRDRIQDRLIELGFVNFNIRIRPGRRCDKIIVSASFYNLSELIITKHELNEELS